MSLFRCIGLILSFLLISSCTDTRSLEPSMSTVKTMDLSQYPSDPPQKSLDLLFIHHSTGGTLLADVGPDIGKDCIYKSHPYGGGLRSLLESNNYRVHRHHIIPLLVIRPIYVTGMPSSGSSWTRSSYARIRMTSFLT